MPLNIPRKAFAQVTPSVIKQELMAEGIPADMASGISKALTRIFSKFASDEKMNYEKIEKGVISNPNPRLIGLATLEPETSDPDVYAELTIINDNGDNSIRGYYGAGEDTGYLQFQDINDGIADAFIGINTDVGDINARVLLRNLVDGTHVDVSADSTDASVEASSSTGGASIRSGIISSVEAFTPTSGGFAATVGTDNHQVLLSGPDDTYAARFLSTPDLTAMDLQRTVGTPGGFVRAEIGEDYSNLTMKKSDADPAAPAANHGVEYYRVNGGGKMEKCVRFPTGAVQVIATEP